MTNETGTDFRMLAKSPQESGRYRPARVAGPRKAVASGSAVNGDAEADR